MQVIHKISTLMKVRMYEKWFMMLLAFTSHFSDLMVDGDKQKFLAEIAERLLLCLKNRFPGLTQTTLDTSTMQCNKDVGKSILVSYSRVLESLAFNVVARIDDLRYVDALTKHSDKLSSSVPTASVIAHKRVPIPYSVLVSSTPYKATFATPRFSPAPLVSPARGERTPFIDNNSNKSQRRGFGVKRALANYLGVETSNPIDGSYSFPNTIDTKGLGLQKDSLAQKKSMQTNQ